MNLNPLIFKTLGTTLWLCNRAPARSPITICKTNLGTGNLAGLPSLLAKTLIRGILLRPQARRFIALNAPLWIRHKPAAAEEDYPAHFHVNLEPDFRAHHAGSVLVETFLAHLQDARSLGVHANVREDNPRARAFFEKLGFTELSRHPFMRLPERPEAVLHSILYGKRL